jgi:hypothetical protein
MVPVTRRANERNRVHICSKLYSKKAPAICRGFFVTTAAHAANAENHPVTEAVPPLFLRRGVFYIPIPMSHMP